MRKLHSISRPRTRTLLLAGVAVGAMVTMVAMRGALAAGGNGGDVVAPLPLGGSSRVEGGQGGGTSVTEPGGNGATGQFGQILIGDNLIRAQGGGGGGGAGQSGGPGGDGVTANSGGQGGVSGVNVGNGAGGGANGAFNSGGGGGGGAHGAIETLPQNTNAQQGGNGGNGANGPFIPPGDQNPLSTNGGGGGGAGGYGLVIEGSNGQTGNESFIGGGNGGYGGNGGSNTNLAGANGGNAGAAGIGVYLSGNNVTFTNTGLIFGGAGGVGGEGVTGGTNGVSTDGGVGVNFAGANGTFVNGSLTSGGFGGANNINGGVGGAGGAGAVFANGGVVNNQASGAILGGQGGDAGFVNTTNFGQTDITSGTGGAGGAGVLGSGLTITNAGQIAGGQGGSGDFSGFPDGGKQVFGAGNGGNGGVGISGANLSITNAATGTISGGAGGNGGVNAPGVFNGGNGGIGILADGATITNAGTIQGGNGGGGTPGGDGPSGTNGIGGIGIVGSNLTIDNNGGTISGGFAGTAVQPPIDASLKILAVQPAPPNGGNQAYAIQFTGGTNYVGTGGTINGGIYVGAGSFQPALNGAAPGTPLTVNGPINFAPGSFYNVRITPTSNDRAIASTSAAGAAGISTLTGAGVNATFANGTYQTGRYTILTANAGVVGQFATLTTSLNSAFLSPFLSYDPTNVYLNIVVTNPTPAGTPNYVPAAITYNQISVASALTQAGIQNGGRGPILNALNQLSAPAARAAFDALSGEGITGAQNSAFRQSQLFSSSISDQTTFGTAANSVELCEPLYSKFLPPEFRRRCEPIRELADLPARNFQPIAPATGTRTWRAWASGWGGTEHLSGNAFPTGSASQNNSLYGGSLGVDYQLLPNYLIGVAVGGSNGDFRVANRGTYGTTTGGHVAIYDLLTLGNWYGASSSSFSYFGNKTTRFVSGFGGLGSETLRGNFDSNQFRSRLEIGRHFTSLPLLGGLPTIAGFGTVTPFVAMELASLRSNGFTEYATRGAGLFRLNVSGQSIGSAPAYAGLRFQRFTPLGNGMLLSPTLQLAYVHEFAPYRNQIGTLANLPGSTFLVDGARPARDAAQVKAGAELAINAHSAIFANFDGEFSGVNQLYAGKGGFRYTW